MSDKYILLSGLGDYISAKDYMRSLEQLPPEPSEARKHDPHVRIAEYIDKIDDQFFLVGDSQYRTAETIHRLITGYYRSLKPWAPMHIRNYYASEPKAYTKPVGGLVQGQPGVGKTISIERSLNRYPQVVKHNEFPHFGRDYLQVVWFSVSMKSYTRRGFVTELATAWNEVFLRYDANLPPPIPQAEIERASVDQLFLSFIRSALVHNLGFIHIDEIQMLFSISSSKGKNTSENVDVKDDITLGKILGLFNTGIPIMFSCTADGTNGLCARGAISQRIGLNNIQFDRFKDIKDSFYIRYLRKLMHYQYTDQSMGVDENLLKLIHQLTAGIPRIIVHCFKEAQRRAINMGKSCISAEDLIGAHESMSEDVKMIIQALHNKDKRFLHTKADYRFEKL